MSADDAEGRDRVRPQLGSDPRLDLETPLTPGDAVAALIVVDGHYLLQLRDMKHGIFFPGHWGCFGGGVDPGETSEQALARELVEELGLELDAGGLAPFTRFDFDFGFAGRRPIRRIFYEVAATRAELSRMTLGEGAEMRLFAPEAILTHAIEMTPYDAFALWMHINQRRLMKK